MKLRLLSIFALFMLSFFCPLELKSQDEGHLLVWKEKSRNSSESMPLGGKGVGLNVWVEKGELLIYFAQNGWFDENNTLLKGGRLRVRLAPSALDEGSFRQVLDTKHGEIRITGTTGSLRQTLTIWADAYSPNVEVMIQSTKPVEATAAYESWRMADRLQTTAENNGNSYKWDKNARAVSIRDSIHASKDRVLFFHKNKEKTLFDVVVKQQGLEPVGSQLINPLGKRIMGGLLTGKGFMYSGITNDSYAGTPFRSWILKAPRRKQHELTLSMRVAEEETSAEWLSAIKEEQWRFSNNRLRLQQETHRWWEERWSNSFIRLLNKNDSLLADAVRNYQLFRFMLAGISDGAYPVKFNGGLYTFDPVFTDPKSSFSPDYRKWGGGIFTAQNQRLLYWPLLRSGDVDLMKPAFDFYVGLLPNAELRTRHYWGHAGASYTEQMEIMGLPNYAEYGLKRPADFDPGVEYNAWLEYEWDTVLEFCLMALETQRYSRTNIRGYLPWILSCVRFFDEHYQYLAGKRSARKLDGNGHLVLYPSSAGETFKMANNPSSVIAGLQVVTDRMLSIGLLSSSDSAYLSGFRQRLPPLPFHRIFGKVTIAPAKTWERVNNVESMMLYPVFPWSIFGVGKPGLDTAVNTYRLDTFAHKFRSHIGWKQDNIFAARLGLTDEALRLTKAKLANGAFRFPAFWGPGFDWTPDHNWGGSGMIGLQEMLMQTPDDRILLFPAWPQTEDVNFKLHAPFQTSVEVKLEKGIITYLNVIPAWREKDIVNCLETIPKP